MSAGSDWTLSEIEAAVLDYMAMLRFELAGQPYNKSAHRRELLKKLDGRSDGSVELKHQNTSAVLRDLGYFWIPGYKPRSNYQMLLADSVERWIAGNPELDRHAQAVAEAPAATPEHFDFSSFEETVPALADGVSPGLREDPGEYGSTPRVARRRDYIAQEARNSSLGRAGEELVVKFEQHKLRSAGQTNLAEKVEHVAQTQGDGLGFDVLSFGADGSERYIEVKTTRFSRDTPFFASASELRFAEQNARRFALYRLFDFRRQPRCFSLNGPIQDHCTLDPVSFRCAFR